MQVWGSIGWGNPLGGREGRLEQQSWILEACLPIVYVPVHIVMGMPMTVGMRMRVAITMGIKNT